MPDVTWLSTGDRAVVVVAKSRKGTAPGPATGRTLSAATVKDDPEIRVGDLALNEETYEVFRGDHRVELTATEFELLRYLMRNPKRVLSKAQILDRVWSYDFGGRSSIVEIYISYLRKKIDTLGPSLIHTVRGVGYVIRPAT